MNFICFTLFPVCKIKININQIFMTLVEIRIIKWIQKKLFFCKKKTCWNVKILCIPNCPIIVLTNEAIGNLNSYLPHPLLWKPDQPPLSRILSGPWPAPFLHTGTNCMFPIGNQATLYMLRFWYTNWLHSRKWGAQ